MAMAEDCPKPEPDWERENEKFLRAVGLMPLHVTRFLDRLPQEPDPIPHDTEDRRQAIRDAKALQHPEIERSIPAWRHSLARILRHWATRIEG